MTTTATTTMTTAKNGAHSSRATSPVRGAAREVRDALGDVGRSMPDMARASGAAVGQLFSAIEAGSDERVSAGVTLSLGLTIGLLIAGAPRLVIALALAPLVAMGLVLADRRAAAAKRSA